MRELQRAQLVVRLGGAQPLHAHRCRTDNNALHRVPQPQHVLVALRHRAPGGQVRGRVHVVREEHGLWAAVHHVAGQVAAEHGRLRERVGERAGDGRKKLHVPVVLRRDGAVAAAAVEDQEEVLDVARAPRDHLLAVRRVLQRGVVGSRRATDALQQAAAVLDQAGGVCVDGVRARLQVQVLDHADVLVHFPCGL